MAQETVADQDNLTADGCYVALTEAPLDVAAILDRVRSPRAGANVLFAGACLLLYRHARDAVSIPFFAS